MRKFEFIGKEFIGEMNLLELNNSYSSPGEGQVRDGCSNMEGEVRGFERLRDHREHSTVVERL
jgi:hypothetical protein